MLVAKSKIAVVFALLAFTCITGRTAASAAIALALLAPSKVKAFKLTILLRTLVIKASVSILTLVVVAAYSASNSSAIALK